MLPPPEQKDRETGIGYEEKTFDKKTQPTSRETVGVATSEKYPTQTTWEEGNPLYPKDVLEKMRENLYSVLQAGEEKTVVDRFLEYLSESKLPKEFYHTMDIIWLLLDCAKAKSKRDIYVAFVRFCVSGHLTIAALFKILPLQAMVDSMSWTWQPLEPTNLEEIREHRLAAAASLMNPTSIPPPEVGVRLGEIGGTEFGRIMLQGGGFTEFLASADFKNLMRLASMAVLASKVQSIWGFIDPAVWETVDHTFMDTRIASLHGVILSGLKLMEWLNEKALVAYNKGFLAAFTFSESSVKKWCADVDDVLTKNDTKPGAQTARLLRVQQLLITGKKLISLLGEKDIGSPLNKGLQADIHRLRVLETDLNNSVSGQRVSPLAILFHGPSCQGKTSVVDITKVAIAAEHGMDGKGGTWTPNSGKYDDGMNLKPWHYNMGEVGHRNPKTQSGEDPDLARFFSWVNNDPLPSNQAELENKGTIMHNPFLVTISTNNRSLDAERYFCRPEAVIRRFAVEVRVEAKVEYCVEGTRRFDPTKADGTYDYWNFEMETSRLEVDPSNPDRSIIRYDRIYTGSSIKMYLNHILALSRKHFAGQEKYIESARSLGDYKICKGCQKMTFPIDMCECVQSASQGFPSILGPVVVGASMVVAAKILSDGMVNAAQTAERVTERIDNRLHRLETTIADVSASTTMSMASISDNATSQMRTITNDALYAIGYEAPQHPPTPAPLDGEVSDADPSSTGQARGEPICVATLLSKQLAHVLWEAISTRIKKIDTKYLKLLGVLSLAGTLAVGYKLFVAADKPTPQSGAYVQETTSSFWAKRDPVVNIKISAQTKSIQADDLDDKITRNVVSAIFCVPTIEGGWTTNFTSGVFIQGNTILTTNHGLPNEGKYVLKMADGTSLEGLIDPANITRFTNYDLACWSVPVKPRPSLINYFHKEGPGDRVSNVSLYFPTNSAKNTWIQEDSKPDTPSLVGVHHYGPAVRVPRTIQGKHYHVWSFIPDATVEIEGKPTVIRAETRAGDCGSPLVGKIGNFAAILGIHVLATFKGASLVQHAESHVVSKERVMELLNKHLDRTAYTVKAPEGASEEIRATFQDYVGVQVFAEPWISGGDMHFQTPSVGHDGKRARDPTLIPLSEKCPLHDKWKELRKVEPDDPITGTIDGPIVAIASFDGVGNTFKTRVKMTPFLEQAKAMGVVQEKVPMSVDEPWKSKSRYLKSINKHKSFPMGPIREVKTAFLNHIIAHTRPGEIQRIAPMTMQEAINGIKDVKFLDAINMDTSMGFPDCAPKKDYFDFVLNPDGTKTWSATHEVYAEIERMKTCYINDETANPIFSTAFKDEPVKPKKISQFKQRIIYGSSVAHTILARMVFGPVFKFIQDNKGPIGSCPGTNSSSPEWEDMMKLLTRYNELVNDGDFVGYDTSLKGDLIIEAKSLMIAIMILSGNYSEEWIKVAWGITYDIGYAHVNFFGDLIQISINPSGQIGTTNDNGVAQVLVGGFSYVVITGKSPEQYFLDVAILTYGDDGIFAVDPSVTGYTVESIGLCLKEYGMTYTNAQKTDDVVPPRRFDDPVNPPTFLKRRWQFNKELGWYASPIDTATLDGMLCTYMSSKVVDFETQFKSTSQSLLYMAAEHGQEVFDLYTHRLKVLAPFLGKLPDYNEVTQSIVENSKEYMNSHRRENLKYSLASIDRARAHRARNES